jgi:hypothetical protein
MISDERKHEYRRIKHSVFSGSQGQPDIVGNRRRRFMGSE